jgi:hypothetical protein
MLTINDARAAKTDYERFLVRHGVPRHYWKLGVEEAKFLSYKVYRTFEGAKNKGNLVRECSDQEQAGYWVGLNQLVENWKPELGQNAENNLIVFCSEDEKLAHYCMYTLVHRMLQSLMKENQKSYRLQTYRYYELWKLLQLDDPLDCPNVVIIPSVIDEGNSNQYTSFRELFTSSYQIFTCTALGPQAFFNKYHVVPGYMFYVESLVKMFDVTKLAERR